MFVYVGQLFLKKTKTLFPLNPQLCIIESFMFSGEFSPSSQTFERSSSSDNRSIQYKSGPEVRGNGIQTEKTARPKLVTKDIH